MSCYNHNSKYWIENLQNLFSSIQVVPLRTMTLTEQLNAITRLMIVIFIIMLLFNFKYSMHFLILSLMFIIIIYYIQRRTMQRCTENFEYDTSALTSTRTVQHNGKKVHEIIIGKPKSLYFCNDEISIDNPRVSELNQNLAGSAHPVTLIPPILAPRSHELEYWRDNNLITHSAINTEVQQDMYLSGYAVSTCCNGGDGGNVETYKQPIVSPTPTTVPVQLLPEILRTPVEQYTPKNTGQEIVSHTPRQLHVNKNTHSIIEGFEYPSSVVESKVQPNQPGWVNTSNGYYPKQVHTSNLPSNISVGNCQKDPSMSQYNKNMFTQTVTPGVYTTSQINEPINSNMGISYQQQFLPLTCTSDSSGNIHYTLHDPRIIEPVKATNTDDPIATEDNIYDPRFYGYGTSYRSYLEPVTGQTRFMYDDINAIRMPNYIVRSKIDTMKGADQVSPMQPGDEFGNRYNANIREMANADWLKNSIDFRTDMMESLMRKRNGELWQQRHSPLGPSQFIAGSRRGN